MIRGSERRTAVYPIDDLFLDRWSPRAMTGEAIPNEVLMSLFEAARWAPSSYNNQPWRMLYAHRDTEEWPLFFNLLVEFNQGWARNAGVLALFISKTTMDMNGEPSITHSFDTGSAWGNFALQGWLKGLVVHGMQGFDYERARIELDIPDGYQVQAMIAVGKPADPDSLPEALREREAPSDRKPLTETTCEGRFCF
jgi:nitroreductase